MNNMLAITVSIPKPIRSHLHEASNSGKL